MSTQVYRIIDANLDRAGEGLRVLEDIARMALNDAALSSQLKTMRHEVVRADSALNQLLLQSRDSESDVGINIEVSGEKKTRDLTEILVANSRRVQESLRTLEELSKLSELKLDPEKFKQARFALYTFERNLMSRLLRKDKIERISGLYGVIDMQFIKGRDYLEITRQIVCGGAHVIQLRDKTGNKNQIFQVAEQLKTLYAELGVLLIINDYLDIALAVDADGLHVGQDDLPAKTARKLLPIDKILGVSVSTVEEARAALADGADYLGVVAFATNTKENVEVVGLQRITEIKKVVSLPVVAIGGINKNNAMQAIEAGADSVAVISAILGADSPEEAARQIAKSIEVKK